MTETTILNQHLITKVFKEQRRRGLLNKLKLALNTMHDKTIYYAIPEGEASTGRFVVLYVCLKYARIC